MDLGNGQGYRRWCQFGHLRCCQFIGIDRVPAHISKLPQERSSRCRENLPNSAKSKAEEKLPPKTNTVVFACGRGPTASVFLISRVCAQQSAPHVNTVKREPVAFFLKHLPLFERLPRLDSESW